MSSNNAQSPRPSIGGSVIVSDSAIIGPSWAGGRSLSVSCSRSWVPHRKRAHKRARKRAWQRNEREAVAADQRVPERKLVRNRKPVPHRKPAHTRAHMRAWRRSEREASAAGQLASERSTDLRKPVHNRKRVPHHKPAQPQQLAQLQQRAQHRKRARRHRRAHKPARKRARKRAWQHSGRVGEPTGPRAAQGTRTGWLHNRKPAQPPPRYRNPRPSHGDRTDRPAHSKC
jgi:hypothetical protein